jgi:hypothetical protein
MKLTNPFLTNLAGLLAAKAIRNWMGTLDYRVAFYDPTVDPASPECEGQKIYVFWHEYILFPIYPRGNCDLAMLLSRHRDAEVLARAGHHLGFESVRGSTYRGGASAVREMMRRGKQMNLTITPDGPRGPRRQLAQGPIYLASRLGMPIVALGCGFDRPWRMRSWDRFALPRPFSRARAVVSPQMHLPADLDRDGVEYYRQRVENMLNRLTSEAEAWAASGSRKLDEQPGVAATRPLRPRNRNALQLGAVAREVDPARLHEAA